MMKVYRSLVAARIGEEAEAFYRVPRTLGEDVMRADGRISVGVVVSLPLLHANSDAYFGLPHARFGAVG